MSREIHLDLQRKRVLERAPSNKDYIDGIILGDGGVYCGSKFSALYNQEANFKYYEWLRQIQRDFFSFGISSTLKFREEKSSYMLRTISYAELLQFRKRWYPNGVKNVPRDINLQSPQLLANWYMGDGYRCKEHDYLRLSTCYFSSEDVEFLKRELSAKLNINVAIHKEPYGLVLYLGKKHGRAREFLNYTKSHKISCFDYKWS